MKSYILSIDQGTTSCRAIVFDKSGNSKGLGQKEFKQSFPQPGWVEHDADEILSTQIACIKDAIKDAGIKPDEIAAVGITNQRETTVVWNKKTGKPVYPAIVWQCRRTQQLAEELRDESNSFREKTGLVPDAYFSGPKIRWILDNVKGARELADKGELAFGTIDTWLIWNLTKDKNHFTEPSNASRTMLYNIHTLKWDDELLSRLQIPLTMMPKVIPSNGKFGETDEKLVGFSAPILANLGDQQAALFGQCCFDVGMGKCTYGTGSFLLTNIGSDAKLVPGLLTTVAWQLEGQPATYAFEGAIFIAGAAIQWLRDGLGIIESSAETQELAESLESNDGVFFVPAFVGLGSPYWNSDVRGTITGLTRGSTKAHLARAALESMAFQIADVAKGMSENGIDVKELRVDGGVTRNNFMVQFQADLLKVPVIRSAQLESTAWGVGALAALTCGLVKDFAELSTDWQQDSKIEPSTDRSNDYEGWQSAVRGAFAVASKSVS
ncbi:MAG: glycerol kinase GlpK [Cyanobacteria bacterium SZAS-4]|nr:glycerol kinase GlpK [Cyanobacteria bacterium SZAS-4]